MATVSSSIHVFQCVHFDGAIFAVPIPKRSFVPAEGVGRTPRYGHHNWRISLVDVARAVIPSTFPIYWIHFPSVQLVRSVQIELSSGRTVASARSEYSILYFIRRKHSDNTSRYPWENSHTCQGTLSFVNTCQEGEEGTLLPRANLYWICYAHLNFSCLQYTKFSAIISILTVIWYGFTDSYIISSVTHTEFGIKFAW